MRRGHSANVFQASLPSAMLHASDENAPRERRLQDGFYLGPIFGSLRKWLPILYLSPRDTPSKGPCKLDQHYIASCGLGFPLPKVPKYQCQMCTHSMSSCIIYSGEGL